MGSEIRESRKSTILGTMAGWLMRAWCSTLRMEVVDNYGFAEKQESEGPIIFALWHNRIFVVPDAWRRLSRGKKFRPVVVLTSASHDGATLARAVGVFGLGSVRGSSSRRAVAALVALRKALREGTNVCVTPDGPRGPRYVMQPGLLKIAETSKSPIVPVDVTFGKTWRLKTWDRFCIPYPFSKVRVIFDEALVVPGDLDEDEFEQWRSRIEQRLRAGTDDMDNNE